MKLIKEDDKLYHFQTPDGEFKVVKKGLSASALAKVNAIKKGSQKFDDGGQVRPNDPDKAADISKQFSQNSTDQAVSQAVQHPIDAISKALSFAKGGAVQKFDDGGGVSAQFDAPVSSDDDSDPDAINPGQPVVSTDRAPASAAPEDDSVMGKIGNFIGDKVIGGTARGIGQLYDATKRDLAPLGQLTQGVEKGLGSDAASSPAPQPDPNAAQTPDQIKAAIAAQGAGSSKAPTMPGVPNYDAQLSSYMNDYTKNATDQAKQQAVSAQTNSDAVGKYLQDGATYLQTQQAEQQKVQDENTQLAKDVANSKVDPNRFVKNMSTGSRIGTAISILFSGIGAGAHGTNMAMGVLQDQINRDIDAQKSDIGNKQNLLTQNLHRLGNMQAATAATQAQRYSMLQGQIMKQAYQDGSAGAMQQAKMATDMLQTKLIPLHQQLGQYQAQRAMLSNPNVDIMTKIMMAGGAGSAQGKVLMAQYQQGIKNQKIMQEYDQASKDAGSLKYLGRTSPAQAALKSDVVGSLHKSTSIRSPELLEEMAGGFTPSRMGNVNGDNNLRRGNLFNSINTQVPAFPTSGTNSEDDQ